MTKFIGASSEMWKETTENENSSPLCFLNLNPLFHSDKNNQENAMS